MFNVLVDVTDRPRAPIDAEMEHLVRAESRRLYSIAFSILQDASEAEDAVQETLISVWRKWPWAAGTKPTPSWLTRVCVNQCLNRRRSRLRRMRLVTTAAGHTRWHAERGDVITQDVTQTSALWWSTDAGASCGPVSFP